MSNILQNQWWSCVRTAIQLDSEVGIEVIGRTEPNFHLLSHALITFLGLFTV